MNPIQRTYKFELSPTKEQKELLAKHFGCIRFVYNYFLDQRKKAYEQTGKSDNYHVPEISGDIEIDDLDHLKNIKN